MTTDRTVPPKIDNAPGLAWRPHSKGWEARWRPRHDLVKRGLPLNSTPLWSGTEPTEIERLRIADDCTRLQNQMRVWGRGGVPVVAGIFDGTLGALATCYRTDADSTYRKLRYRSRRFYDVLTNRIVKDHGTEGLHTIKARTFLRWHEDWSVDGKIAMGHSMMGMLRTLFSFGATILEDEECERLSAVLHKMRFPMAKPRSERVTSEQADAIRAKAHEMGLPSVALAQAFQFELMLRQKDVIGEWVPITEPGTSDILDGRKKWLRGIRWSEIDKDLILRHTTSKRQKDIEVDLRRAPMVMDELGRLGAIPASGPIIVSEIVNRPYGEHSFRKTWRKIATAAGVPEEVKNMDNRAGAISEATDAGAQLEHVRHAATHGDIAMTQRYSRGSVEKIAQVQDIRAAHRNKKRT